MTAVVAGASLLLGFAVAELTGVRGLGGVVLLVALLWCVRAWWRLSPGTAAALSLVYLLAFVGAHVVARWVGAWPAVGAAAVLVAVVVHLMTTRGPGIARPGPT